jgi:hypothetical protein
MMVTSSDVQSRYTERETIMKTVLFIGFAVFMLVVVACASPGIPTPTPTPDPIAVLQGYYEALKAKDLDRLMSFVADNAVFMVARNIKSDEPAEIRADLQTAINDGVTVEVSNVVNTNGRLTYDVVVSATNSADVRGTGFTIVKDGKIIFDGDEENLAVECSRDASQVFCAVK